MTVGISYGADIDKAKAVIEKVINKEELILQNIPIKVYVESLDSSAVTIGLRAFVKNEDYFPAKWALTENIKKALDEAFKTDEPYIVDFVIEPMEVV